MQTRVIRITLKGVSPLLMHAFPMVPIEAIEKLSPQEQAELSAYRTPEKELYIPGVAMQRAFVKGAAYSKGKGRSTLQKVAAACLIVRQECIGTGVKSFAVDSRPVVIAATRGRVLRHRPRLNEWQVSFDLEYDPTLMKESEVRRVVDDTGQRVGVLDFRPEKNGPFGRFVVTHWE